SPRGGDRVRSDAADVGRPSSPGMIIALAHPDRVARLVNGRDVYLLASGTRATLPPGSSLAGEEWLAIAEATRAGGRSTAETGAIVRAGAPITEGDARAAAASLLRHTATVSLEQGRLTAREGARLGAIELTSTPVPVSVEGARAALASALERDG